jgi:hypothetical protein
LVRVTVSLTLALLVGSLVGSYYFVFSQLRSEALARARSQLAQDRDSSIAIVGDVSKELREAKRLAVASGLETGLRSLVANGPSEIRRRFYSLERGPQAADGVLVCDAAGQVVLRTGRNPPERCPNPSRSPDTSLSVEGESVSRLVVLVLFDTKGVAGTLTLRRELAEQLLTRVRTGLAVLSAGKVVVSNLEPTERAQLQHGLGLLSAGEVEIIRLAGDAFLATRWDVPEAKGVSVIHLQPESLILLPVGDLKKAYLAVAGIVFLIGSLLTFLSFRGSRVRVGAPTETPAPAVVAVFPPAASPPAAEAPPTLEEVPRARAPTPAPRDVTSMRDFDLEVEEDTNPTVISRMPIEPPPPSPESPPEPSPAASVPPPRASPKAGSEPEPDTTYRHILKRPTRPGSRGK